MDREQANELANKFWREHVGAQHAPFHPNYAIDAIIAAHAQGRAEGAEWVPVSVRMPEPGVWVLAFSRGVVYLAAWTIDNGFDNLPDVTHWMPEPAPPKEAT